MQVDDQNNHKVCTAQKELNINNPNSIFSRELKELKNENRKSVLINPTIQVSESGNKKNVTEMTKVGWMLEGSMTSSGTKTSSTSELG